MLGLIVATIISVTGTAPVRANLGTCSHPIDGGAYDSLWAHTRVVGLPIPYAFILEESTFVRAGGGFGRCYDTTASGKTYWLVTTWASTRRGVPQVCAPRSIIAFKRDGACP